MARKARAAIDDSREQVAEAIGFSPHGIVFTSGGTESDNLGIKGFSDRPGFVMCPETEHHAVLHPVEVLGGKKVRVTDEGQVDLDHLSELLKSTTSLVSVMMVNNESGAICDLDKVAEVIEDISPGTLLHTDAVQAVNWVDIKKAAAKADLLSLSGHKFGAPKGVGVLALREGVTIQAQMLGGGQEAERRSGTHNTAGIVAFGAALMELTSSRDSEISRLTKERDRLVDGLLATIDRCAETVPRSSRSAGITQLVFEGIESEALLVLLERDNVMASAAASCASGAMEPSHVLAAMGMDRTAAAGSLRLSMGWCTESREIDVALKVIPKAVEQLRVSL
jgi:cysteine desulfurase|tara:strand:+ start:8872 stop:9882 length:1011 start_codon:yes stop_codon:yes gene_type:complete